MATIARRRRTPEAPAETTTAHRVQRVRPTSTHAPEPTKEEFFALVRKFLMTPEMVSEYTGLPERTISVYHTSRGNMPKPEIFLGKKPCWHRDTIVEWEANRPKMPGRRAKA